MVSFAIKKKKLKKKKKKIEERRREGRKRAFESRENMARSAAIWPESVT